MAVAMAMATLAGDGAGCGSSGMSAAPPGSGGAGGSVVLGSGGSGGSGGLPGDAAAADVATGGDAPAVAVSIRDGLTALTRTCKMTVGHVYGFDSDPQDPDKGKTTQICALDGAIFWIADMDIDCDGKATPGKCDREDDCCYAPDTSLHGNNGPLTAAVTPYVVLPTDFVQPGLELGTVVAVIYNNQMTYAIFGDTGPNDIIGEASYACAERLGINPSAKNGGALGATVTYVAFTKGTASVPQDVEDQDQTRTLGESLAKELLEKNQP